MSSTVHAGDVARNIHLWTTGDMKFSLFTATEKSPVLLAFFPCAFTKHENKVWGLACVKIGIAMEIFPSNQARERENDTRFSSTQKNVPSRVISSFWVYFWSPIESARRGSVENKWAQWSHCFEKHSRLDSRQVLNGINDKYNKLYKDLNVRVVGISTDTHWTLDAYQQQKNIKFEMASDFNKEAARAYGILVDKYSSYGYNGVAKEACFLIAFDQ